MGWALPTISELTDFGKDKPTSRCQTLRSKDYRPKSWNRKRWNFTQIPRVVKTYLPKNVCFLLVSIWRNHSFHRFENWTFCHNCHKKPSQKIEMSPSQYRVGHPSEVLKSRKRSQKSSKLKEQRAQHTDINTEEVENKPMLEVQTKWTNELISIGLPDLPRFNWKWGFEASEIIT